MLSREWNDKINRTIVARARQEETDLENALVAELSSYLEGKSSLFSEVATSDRVSLHDLGYSDTLRAHPPRQPAPQRLREMLEQAETLELSVFDLLHTAVEADELELRDALTIAFQLGKRVSHLAEQIAQNEHSEHELTRPEQHAVRQELLARHDGQHAERLTQAESAPDQPTPTRQPHSHRYAPQFASPVREDQ